MKGTSGDNSSATRVLLLLSGGLDSTACADFFLRKKFHVEGVHFNYGQAAAEMEFASAQAIAKHYGIKLHYHQLLNARPKGSGPLVGRNAFLLFAALSEFPWEVGLIGIGIHSGTHYFDCTSAFTIQLQNIFDGYSNGRIRIAAPFLTWEKPRIWDYCVNEKIPISETYSCEIGSQEPCGKCASCKDMEVLNG
jgi:7-cyano-7-deazaguanine synthase